ncbi:hypothetical protein [Jiangella sp. DSM 45060]|uniref:hypothetical protein n=1 Tax=Jiangella sp. DSM 45060 TaxID=1798224 RepID=UPI00087BD60F|nr:hypothetical protein [Jiangella sp. DSM 45060]SDT72334.1 hypothetical protein SAMN04515669_6638 [Jiangella sp. DSM 45060]
MIDQNWVVLSAALGLIGGLRYAVATMRGRASPNRVTWVLWAAAPLIAFSAQLDAGVGLPAVLTLAAGVGPLIVLTASFAGRHGSATITPFDLACGAVSVIALLVWIGLGSASWAVVVAVAADAAAATPTVRKAWREPHTENALFYVLVGLGATVTLLTITDPAPASWLFAAYMLALSLTLTAVIAGRSAP